ncbi:hypothetical protein V5O48_016774 [Marasmius crinis-equi]|uniref:Uncharacterized protein n=1 Tax=Marasmius crinis-equi TaxID=585013 RepID=A0ABR3EQS5_9AGAR
MGDRKARRKEAESLKGFDKDAETRLESLFAERPWGTQAPKTSSPADLSRIKLLREQHQHSVEENLVLHKRLQRVEKEYKDRLEQKDLELNVLRDENAAIRYQMAEDGSELIEIRLLREQLKRVEDKNMALQESLQSAEKEYKDQLEEKDHELSVIRDENTAIHCQMVEDKAQFVEMFYGHLDKAIKRSLECCSICLEDYSPERLPTV